ncbi:tetratricopeptide repeat protein [Mucilaginibacter pineti]|nr:hypothetical protein [Mucilaginibacter pineti]
MLRLSLSLLLICCSFKAALSQPHVKKDSLVNFIQLKDQGQRERKVTRYIKSAFQNLPVEKADSTKQAIVHTFANYSFDNKEAIVHFLESVYQRQLLKFNESRRALMSAINEAHKSDDHYLLYLFFSHQAFLQTDQGNAIDAVYSYGLAKNEARKLNDPYLEVLLNVNISDIYYKSGLYAQSLSYLNKVQEINDTLKRLNIYSLLSYNRAENYFRMKNYDSLKLCNEKLNGSLNRTYKLHTYQKRTAYYLHLLKHDYKGAIKLINKLVKDSLYIKSDAEHLNLADAYFSNGQIDSAQYIVNVLLVQPSISNHPEIKYHLYELLGNIAQIKKDDKLAAYNFKLALEQSKQNINNLTQVGDISSKIKLDEVQDRYYMNVLKYKHERLWLIFSIVMTGCMVIIFAIFYRSNRQKSHYEKLLFESKKRELALINSHEVRNHLSNILGLLDIMRDCDTKEELLQTQAYLQYSAQELDKNLKNVSRKLSD